MRRNGFERVWWSAVFIGALAIVAAVLVTEVLT
jgi:hypothetical protein